MKHFFVFLMCFHTLIGYSQVHKFKAFESCLDESGGESKIADSKWKKVDILVVVNLTTKKVKIYGNKQGDYDITMVNDPIKNKNDDEVLVFHAVDGDGDECDILITVFKEHDADHYATMRIKYSIGDMVFRLKSDD
jgi:hypothetical protein